MNVPTLLLCLVLAYSTPGTAHGGECYVHNTMCMQKMCFAPPPVAATSSRLCGRPTAAGRTSPPPYDARMRLRRSVKCHRRKGVEMVVGEDRRVRPSPPVALVTGSGRGLGYHVASQVSRVCLSFVRHTMQCFGWSGCPCFSTYQCLSLGISLSSCVDLSDAVSMCTHSQLLDEGFYVVMGVRDEDSESRLALEKRLELQGVSPPLPLGEKRERKREKDIERESEQGKERQRV